jgi:hypothetical protein
LLIRSDLLVMHEVTNGPFTEGQTILAPFAPPEDQADRAKAYMAELEERVKRHPANRR